MFNRKEIPKPSRYATASIQLDLNWRGNAGNLYKGLAFAGHYRDNDHSNTGHYRDNDHSNTGHYRDNDQSNTGHYRDNEINSCFLQWRDTGSGDRTCESSLDTTRSTARLWKSFTELYKNQSSHCRLYKNMLSVHFIHQTIQSVSSYIFPCNTF